MGWEDAPPVVLRAGFGIESSTLRTKTGVSAELLRPMLAPEAKLTAGVPVMPVMAVAP